MLGTRCNLIATDHVLVHSYHNSEMFEEVASNVPDVTVLRRLLFAAVHIPKATPRYSELVTDFAYGACEEKPSPDKIRVLLENLEFLNKKHLPQIASYWQTWLARRTSRYIHLELF